MRRDQLANLNAWYKDPFRKPLIIRGARQVGKSWLVREFGKQFPHFIEVNFDKQRKAFDWFKGDLKISDILQRISYATGQPIIPEKTLIFLDEIQECEDALKALRYFKEDAADIVVIAAGSLLDFTLNKLGMPVGRVQFLYLYPLSFSEFLLAIGREDLQQYIYADRSDSVIHDIILDYVHLYCGLGGMPAVVDAWRHSEDTQLCQRTQDEILITYQQDFYKYARSQQIEYVSKVFEKIPIQLGRKFKYVNVDPELRSYMLKNALYLLKNAGIANLCYHTAGQQPPLGAMQKDTLFKVYFLDVGLAQRLLDLDLTDWQLNRPGLNNKGAITEQFVAQEIICHASSHIPAKLYYWHREAKSSNAEVDFLLVKKGEIIPVEVKSSRQGRMKSLQLFLDSHPQSSFSLKISAGLPAKQKNLREIPLYAIGAWLSEEST